MKKRKLLLHLFFFGLSHVSLSQDKVLSINDSLPLNQSYEILNYPNSKLNISELKGKLIILDFWSTTCGPCIAAMPKMDSLQNKFKGKIDIIPVIPVRAINQDVLNDVSKFWRTNKYTSRTKLPTVVDTQLYKYFGVEGVPYEVWVYQNKVIALTGAEYVNEIEINKILQGTIPNWEIKNKILFDYEKPLQNSVNFQEGSGNAIMSSAFLKYLPRVRPKVIIDSFESRTRVYFINTSLIEMYRSIIAHLSDKNHPSIRFLKNIKQIENIEYKPGKLYRNDWDRINTFCYEGIFPRNISKSEALNYVIKELDLFSGYQSKKITKLEDCFVIVEKGSNTAPTSASIANDTLNDFLTYEDIHMLLTELNNSYFKVPFINELSGTQKIELKIPREVFLRGDLSALKNILNRKGFDIRAQKRQLEYFVIEDK